MPYEDRLDVVMANCCREQLDREKRLAAEAAAGDQITIPVKTYEKLKRAANLGSLGHLGPLTAVESRRPRKVRIRNASS